MGTCVAGGLCHPRGMQDLPHGLESVTSLVASRGEKITHASPCQGCSAGTPPPAIPYAIECLQAAPRDIRSVYRLAPIAAVFSIIANCAVLFAPVCLHLKGLHRTASNAPVLISKPHIVGESFHVGTPVSPGSYTLHARLPLEDHRPVDTAHWLAELETLNPLHAHQPLELEPIHPRRRAPAAGAGNPCGMRRSTPCPPRTPAEPRVL